MAITELTKRVVLQQREVLRQRYERNLKDIAELEDAIAKYKAANVTLKARIDALKRDVPEPTPTPSVS